MSTSISWSSGPDDEIPAGLQRPDLLDEEELLSSPVPAAEPQFRADPSPVPPARPMLPAAEPVRRSPLQWRLLESNVETLLQRQPSLINEGVAVLQATAANCATLAAAIDQYLVTLDHSNSEVAASLFERRSILVRQLGDLHTRLLSLAEVRQREQMAAPAPVPATTSAAVPPHVKLPKLEIRKFNGKSSDWVEFKTQFVSTIHTNASIDDGQRFRYLSTLLHGEPSHLVKHLPCSAGNYGQAWQIICDHYDDPRLLMQMHVESLLELPSTKSGKSSARELYVNAKQHLAGIRTLERENAELDPAATAYIYLLLSKCTAAVRKEFRKEVRKTPAIGSSEAAFLDFLRNIAQVEEEPSGERIGIQKRAVVSVAVQQSQHADKRRFCANCKERTNHFIAECSQFAQLAPDKQLMVVRRGGLCYACLRKSCNRRCSRDRCAICRGRHHTILHQALGLRQPWSLPKAEMKTESKAENAGPTMSVAGNSKTADSKYQTQNYELVLKALNMTSNNSQSILATAVIEVRNGSLIKKVRALLDSGSQRNFLSSKVASELNLSIINKVNRLSGVSNISTLAVNQALVTLASCRTQYETQIEVLLLDTIVETLPSTYFDISDWKLPDTIPLADPSFNIPGEIDMLIGSDLFWDIVQSRKLRVHQSSIQLRKTALGWIVVGQLNVDEYVSDISTVALMVDLMSTVEKFWTLEEIPQHKIIWTKEQQECERIFVETTTKQLNGPFTVYLPFKIDPKSLGNSLNNAINQFLYLEKRLHKDSKLMERYSKCIKEYETLGHCRVISQEEWSDKDAYYIPHHAVIKETSTSTKLRVVFNASKKTSSGLSLNECMMVGPVVQEELISILMRFRMKKYAFSADITKMYRQIRVHKSHTRYQRIIWRDKVDQPLICYELQTVTFGTASAPFLATRCIREVGLTIRHSDPLSSSALLNDFYVDDILSGANTIEEARHMQVHITESLKNAGFPLTKWCVNHSQLLEGIPHSDIEHEFPLSEDGEATIKTLGILWRPGEDVFQFFITKQFTIAKTKREILSAIASVYDPLGLAGPVIALLKMFMQSICKVTTTNKESWNAPLPQYLIAEWQTLAAQLHTLKKIKIPRYYFDELPQSIELHGFCDASEKAYGAVIYVRGVNHGRAPCVHLMISKSRVAPLKVQSLPKLELCGATLLADLVSKIKRMLEVQYSVRLVRLWCDSTIALSWIHSPSYRYETFIANRVQKVQDLTVDYKWDHVDSETNAADILSRGIAPSQLKSCAIWWQGPQWLHSNWEPWSLQTMFVPIPNLELGVKKTELYSYVQLTILKSDLFERYSEFTKLVRITAYLMRFAHRVFYSTKQTGSLSLNELKCAKTLLIKLAQGEFFSSEIKALRSGTNSQNNNPIISNASEITHLTPFLDKFGVLRVGGRLEDAPISWDQRNPILMHPKHPLTTLIIRSEHLTHFHAGPRLLKSVLRRNYWVLRQHSAVQDCIRKCVKCTKVKAVTQSQIMASLPKSRVSPSRPFQITGVDYAGPVTIRCHNGRHKINFKAYVALFICYSTKAVHLEVVANLSSLAFLNALSRFISRRGKPSEIHSDNGTSFVGANSLLNAQLRKFLKEHQNKIVDYANKEGIDWHFIPAYTPHWGGLWESNIKTMKFHLKRIITANSCFNFEEFQTLLNKVEAILNSRPLTPESSDPNDLNALTPGHFLIGAPLTAFPEEIVDMKSDCHTKRWKLVQQLTKQFWKRWAGDYLNTLHQRHKWKHTKNDLKVGDFVIVKDSNLPPMCWCMGRVIEVHQGKDNKVRLVQVKTKNAILKCPIVNLVYLPIQ